EPERHRLQRARLVARNLEPLDLRRERHAVVYDHLGRPAAPLREQVANALAAADQSDGAKQRVAVPEDQPWLVEQPALDALHGESDGAARADRVDSELVAALRRTQNDVGVTHAAQGAERE